MLRIEHLTKVYPNGSVGLRDVSFEVDEGEFLVVIGLSGSGKSTLLPCINRLIEPTEGKIFWDDTELTAASAKEMRRIRRHIGMVFQQFNLVNGTFAAGTPSGVPADAETRWKNVIAEVRQHFRGPVLWALPYNDSNVQAPVNILRDADGVYLLWSAKLSDQSVPNKIDMTNEAGRLLDNSVAPLQSLLNKPIVIALVYPSATSSASGCLPNGSGGCLDWQALSRPNPDMGMVNLDLELQADIYEAMLNAVNARQWVSGFISRGYYPPVALQDKSASVHGKPAADLLWYWFPRLLGNIK